MHNSVKILKTTKVHERVNRTACELYLNKAVFKNSDSGLQSDLMNQNQRQEDKTILKDPLGAPMKLVWDTWATLPGSDKPQRLAERKQSFLRTSQWLTACKSI